MPAPPRGALSAALRVYDRSLIGVACVLIVAIVTIMGAQVFFRYVLNNSLIWAEEVCGYLLVWITFLFLGPAFQRGELVVVGILTSRLGRRWKVVLLTVGYGCTLAFLAMLVFYGYRFAQFNTVTTVPAADFIWSSIVGRSTEIEMSAFWIYLSVPIGCALLFVHILAWLVARLAEARRGGDPSVEPGGGPTAAPAAEPAAGGPPASGAS